MSHMCLINKSIYMYSGLMGYILPQAGRVKWVFLFKMMGLSPQP